MKIPSAIHPGPNAIFLGRSLFWSRATVWTIVLTAVFLILWACVGRIDQVIAATGKLEPKGSVFEVQTPEGGVITEILVKEGDVVKKGDVLARLDPDVMEARLGSLQSMLDTLRRENAAYDLLLTGKGDASASKEAQSLIEYRARLLAENNFLRAQVALSTEGLTLTDHYRRLFETTFKDRQEQIEQAELKRLSAESELQAIDNQLGESKRLKANSEAILEAYTKLVNANAGSRLEHLVRQGDVIRDNARMMNLSDRQETLRLTIQQALEEKRNIETSFAKDAMTRLAENEKALSELDSNTAKSKLQNDQRIAEIQGQIVGLETSLSDRVIRSPADGTVFDLKADKPGDVVTAAGILMQIVPSGELIAKVEITNRDIGFVELGMQAGVRLDSFPFREFGEIPGTLTFIGSDVLPPDQTIPYYRFPTRISLERQTMKVGTRDIPLQSGMSVTVNIHVRRRTIMSIFTDSLLGPLDRMREVR